MINNENTMYMYCNVLGQTEPEKILDIGLFYRQIGGVSRTILNSDVPKKCFITGIDLENSKNYFRAKLKAKINYFKGIYILIIPNIKIKNN